MAEFVKNIQESERAARKKRRKKRDRKRALNASARKRRHSIIAKVLAALILLGVTLALALLVGDANYQATALGWVPFFMVLVMLVVAGVYVQVLRRCISFQEVAESFDCMRGEDVRFDVDFKNKGPLFFFRIEAYFFVSDLYGNVASEKMTTLTLGPFEQLRMGFTTTFEHIGTYQAGLRRLVIADFLGLFTWTIENKSQREINVTPRLQILSNIQFSNDAMLETSRAAKSIIADSMDYSHVRDYVPGDPLKTIHWNLSARAGSYMTRLYEKYTNPGVGIIMDFYAPSTEAVELMGMFDAVVESALSLERYSRECGMETELFFNDKRGERRRMTSASSDSMAELISELPRMSNDPNAEPLAMKILQDQIVSQFGQNNIVVCSANLNSELVSLIVDAKIRRRQPMMIAVVPLGMSGRVRDDYCKALSRLDDADIPYFIITRSEELVGGGEQ